MKQHIFSKSGLLLAFLSVFLSFFACQQDQFMDTSPPNEEAVFKQSAKQFYENALVDLRKANIDKVKTDARLTALDFLPDWDAVITHTGNNKTYLEIPVKFAGSSTIISSAFSTTTQFNPDADIPIPIRLIITKSDQGALDADFMGIRSESPYSNGVIPNFNLFKKIDNFTGREYVFNLDGSFDRGWIHKEGKIINSLVLIKNDLRQQASSRLCAAWFLIGSQGQIIAQVSDWECQGQGGGSFSGAGTNGTGIGTTGSTGWGNGSVTPDCTGTSGTSCELSTLYFASLGEDPNNGEPTGYMSSMTYRHSITVTNCPLRQYTSNAITYVQKTRFGYPGSFQSNNQNTVNGPAVPIDPQQPRGGFKTFVYCTANATFTLWSGPWGGIPMNEDLSEDAAYFVR